MGDISPVQVVLLPHSHWDREWYEPFASFRLTLAAMMNVGLGLLDEPGQTAVLAEGVMEYEVTDASIAVTLLRAVGIIAKPTVPTRPIWAGPSIAAPDGQCQGTYRMSFGINPSARAENLVHDHECFALPLLEIETDGGGAHDTGQLLDVAGACISAIRRRGDALEVRVWNDSVTHQTASVWGWRSSWALQRYAPSRWRAGDPDPQPLATRHRFDRNYVVNGRNCGCGPATGRESEADQRVRRSHPRDRCDRRLARRAGSRQRACRPHDARHAHHGGH